MSDDVAHARAEAERSGMRKVWHNPTPAYDMIVVDDVVYYSLDAAAPVLTRNAPGDKPDFLVWGDRLLESCDNGLTCWEVV